MEKKEKNEAYVEQSDGAFLVEVSSLNRLLEILHCPKCKHAGVKLSLEGRTAYAQKGSLYCRQCKENIAESYLG